jgi:hypothetical protein
MIANLVRNCKKKIAYSPDIMLYKKFPRSKEELFEFISGSARQRARQFKNSGRAVFEDNFYLLPVFLLLFIIASVFLALMTRCLIYLIPLTLYYMFILFSRIIFHGFRRGIRGFFYLCALQISYGINFLSGLMLRK